MSQRRKSPLDRMFENVAKELYKGINEFLAENIDLSKLTASFMKYLKASGGFGMPSQFDYYQVLGLDRSASDDEVKRRYRAIMMKIHPDKAGKELTFLTSLVNTAYQAICMEREI